MRAAAEEPEHNGVWMVGVGVEQPLVDTRCWLYFPTRPCRSTGSTNFARYAAANVPGGDTARYCSFLTETAYSRHRQVEPEAARGAGAPRAGAVGLRRRRPPTVVSTHLVDIDYAYPVPTLTRDAALRTIQPWLRGHDILSRGRFGAWRYEIGNMDHAVKMGIDAARLVAEGRPEELWTA